MHRWSQANRPPSARWNRHSAKPFLEKFSRQCLSRWLAESSGHGDFLKYHTRFNHSPEANKERPCGGAVSRSHFFSCPLTSFNNPLVGRLDPGGKPGTLPQGTLSRYHTSLAPLSQALPKPNVRI